MTSLVLDYSSLKVNVALPAGIDYDLSQQAADKLNAEKLAQIAGNVMDQINTATAAALPSCTAA